MAYTLSNKCAKNYCKQTILVQVTIEYVFFHVFWNTVYVGQNSLFQLTGSGRDVKRGQMLEAEVEAKAKHLRPRSRPRPCLTDRVWGQS